MNNCHVEPSDVKSQKKKLILSMQGISKYFGGVQALQDVDIEIHEAEVIALVGDNGAGKSTLLKVISGVNPPEKGVIRLDGKEVAITNTLDPVRYGIQTVYQDLALCDNMDITENIFLGRELVMKNGRLAKSKMEAFAKSCMEELGIDLDNMHIKAGELSGGQRQAVAIARAMLGNPRIVLLDEPLANLGLIQRKQVGELIKRLRSKGYGVVVVSHDLLEVFEVADRVVVLRLGKKVAEIERADITHEKVVAQITGRDDFFDDEE